MRRKEERSKQGQTNNKAKQHSTPKAVTFPKKNELPRVGLEPTTHVYTSVLYSEIHVIMKGDKIEVLDNVGGTYDTILLKCHNFKGTSKGEAKEGTPGNEANLLPTQEHENRVVL